jgi:hypothetical protein
MEFEFESNWQEVHVELMKYLHGYEVEDVDGETGYVDYVAEGEGDERKLLRVIVGPRHRASRAFVKNVEDTLEKIEEGGFDEAKLMAKSFTSASKRMVRGEDDLEMISPKQRHHPVTDVIGAIQNLTKELCEAKCGGLPETEEDCEGLVDGEYRCDVRRISDDSDFHAKMGWLTLLMNDFSRLVALQREIDR